jgi:hypothetical protein
MTPEQTLAAIFAADAAPRRDPVFEAEVAQRVARRRIGLTVLALAPWTTVAAILLWALQPVLTDVAVGLALGLQPLGLATGVIVATLGGAAWLARGLQRRTRVAATPK